MQEIRGQIFVKEGILWEGDINRGGLGCFKYFVFAFNGERLGCFRKREKGKRRNMYKHNFHKLSK